MRVLVLLGLLSLLAPAAHAQDAPRWRIARTAQAGAGDGPGALTAVGGLTVGRDGSLYVSQPQDGVVRVYDARGRFARAFGKSGEGPGEFRRPSQLGWRGDTLWVTDAGQTRISLFRADGTFLRSIAFVRESPLTDGKPNIPGALLADGSVLGWWQAPLRTLSEPGPVSQPLVRFTQGGEPLGLVGRLQRRNEFMALRRQTGVTFLAQPFSDSPLWAPSPDGSGVVIVTRAAATSAGRATFAVRRVDPAGRTVFSRTYPYTPRPLEGDAVSAAVDAELARLASARLATPPASLRRMIGAEIYRPKFRTPVTGVLVGRDGTVWLRREEGGSVVRWDVLDAAGRPAGTLNLPAKLDVRYADRTQLWAVELDELDVPTLARFQVQPGS